MPASTTLGLRPARPLLRTRTAKQTLLPKHVCTSIKRHGALPTRYDATQVMQTMGGFAANLALSMAVICAPMVSTPAPAMAEPVIIRIPASKDPEVFAAQQTLVEVWSIVGETFVDPDFNGLDWPEELTRRMMTAYNATDSAVARQQLDEMLVGLGDPYTRHINSNDYQRFRVSADGELQGVGLLIANQLSDGGHLLVLAPIKGGPADRAGVLPGDEVVTIDGHQTQGLSGEQAAQLLRGRGGTEVRVQLARRTEQIPGVAGVPEARPELLMKEISLKRERVTLSPVFYTALPNELEGGKRNVGYLRLTQFSNNAAEDMRNAIKDLESQGMDQYILDLRSNPGGLVSASIDIASLWLDGEQPVFNIQGRGGENLVQTTQQDLPALTQDPLVVLVDDGSASASEILSGALRDNHRAQIIGDNPTFGKGRIQTVYELQDGSALFVTVAKYQTPGGSEIDLQGIAPDRSCRPEMNMNPRFSFASQAPAAPALAAEPLLPAFSPGIPMGTVMEESLVSQLQADSCVLAAEQVLQQQVKAQWNGMVAAS